jgi:hypothetical protein
VWFAHLGLVYGFIASSKRNKAKQKKGEDNYSKGEAERRRIE